MTSAQCRDARRLLGWSQRVLAEYADVSVATIRRFERDVTDPQPLLRLAIQDAFERAGVVFVTDRQRRGAVRWRGK